MTSDTKRALRGGLLLARGVGLALAVLLWAGCSDLLEVELRDAITGEGLEDPGGAEVQVNSAIALVECAYTSFVAGNAAGNEDVFMRHTGSMSGFAEYSTTPGTGTCDTSDQSYSWWNTMQTGRLIAEETYGRLTEWSVEVVSDRERFLTLTSLYAAVPYQVFGEHLCDIAIETGPLMSPDETLAVGEEWVTTTLDHVAVSGDFEMPYGIASSIEETAYALRARIRWARGDYAGAAADAARVSRGFEAVVTRDAGETRRRNKVTTAHFTNRYATVIGPIDWWDGPAGPGGPWPEVIPFTGYIDLGVLPDGRAVDPTGYPITTDEPDAVADPRVEVSEGALASDGEGWIQNKYTDEADPIPLVSWEEIWLIRAEIENEMNGDRAAAIGLVDDLRDAAGLPRVTYLDGSATQDQVDDMIIEERRRALWLEGRFWSTKIQNTDKLWFPRGVGVTPEGNEYEDAVRMVMDDDEFDLNRNFDRSARATMCDPAQAPSLLGE